MPNTAIENKLRENARERIRSGHLPCAKPVRMWGGRGSGKLCAVCGEVIPADEVEYEIEAEIGGTALLAHFHFLCHAAWQFECAREATLAKANSPG